MEFQNFNLIHCKKLSLTKQKKYISSHFFPLDTGDHVIKEIDNKNNIKLKIVDSKCVNTFLNRLPKETRTYYYFENDKVKKLVYELNKPEQFEDKINLIGRFKHKIQPYESFDQKLKDGVNIMLNHIKVVLANDDEIHYNFLLDWYAFMLKGGKNKTILYYKANQGVGKSTLTDFLRVHVIGDQLSLQSNSEPLRSKFNAILAGMLFVTFEELENFSIADWANISSVLKRNSTSDVAIYEKKGIDSFSADNINNYNCISNNDAIKDDQGRRYFKADISSKHVDDTVYFDKIYDNCFNDQVGAAFYNLLIERDLTNYDHTRVPLTQSKLDSFANRLCSVAQFLKEVYVLRKQDFFGNVGVVYNSFVSYCTKKGLKNLSKIEFCKQLREWNLDFSKHSNELRYKIKFDILLAYATKNNWIHVLDEFELPEQEIKTIRLTEVKIEIIEAKKANIDIVKIYNDINYIYDNQPKLNYDKFKIEIDEVMNMKLFQPVIELSNYTEKQETATDQNYEDDSDYDSDDDDILFQDFKHNLNELLE